MNIRVNQRKIPTVVAEGKLRSITSGVLKRNRGFQIPFSERRVILIVGDLLALALATGGSVLLNDPSTSISAIISLAAERWPLTALWFVVWYGISSLNDLYDIPSAHKRTLTLSRIVVTGQLSVLIFLPISLLFSFPLSPLATSLALILALPLVFAWRLVYRSAQTLPPFKHRILIVGNGKRAELIAAIVQAKKDLNFDVLGYVDDQLASPDSSILDSMVLGNIRELPQLAKKQWAREIVIASDDELEPQLFQYISNCQALGIRVTSMADFYARLERKIPVEYIGTNWVLHAIQDRALFRGLQLAFKRLMDLLLLLFGLPVLALLLPLLALLIHLDSPGPIFYRQVRSGRGGAPFWILKFRTMIADAEKAGKPQWATERDPRITRVGHFLRKSRLDEVPQLINILRGEMSFVGPRPERPEFVGMLREQIPFYDTRMMIRPGLTGWAQVHYDYGNSTDDALVKLQHDFFYIRHWTFWMDVYVLFRTVAVVLQLKGL